jgi:exosortase/archaeosortase family protein
MMTPLETHDPYKIAKYWTFFCIVSLFFFIITIQKSSYFEMDALGMWILSCLAIFYLSRNNPKQFSVTQQRIIILFGILICILSFTSISLGITNPPYSIGEFSLLLSGIGVMIFGLYNFRSLVLPVSIPFMAVMCFWAYEQFIRNQDWITAPIIPYIVIITVSLLHLLGINAVTHGNIISFLSQTGGMIYLSIVSDCSGIWSLGTFTIAVAIVLTSFPQSISKKSILVIGVGYLGTFCANIIRIVAIALSGYYFGPTGVIEQVHVHIGWIVFSAWMIIFWYYYFTRQAGISFFKKRESQDKDNISK